MKSVLYLILFVGTVLQLNGQQAIQFTQYFVDQATYNPGYVGSDPGVSATLFARQQWTGIEGAPQTISLSVHYPSPRLKAGLGFSYYNDQIGNFSYNIVQGAIAKKYRWGVKYLNAAISPAVYLLSVQDNWVAVDGVDVDPSIQAISGSGFTADVNVGFLFKTPKTLLGLAVNNVIGQRIKRLGFDLTRYAFLSGQYAIEKSGSDLSFVPGFLLKSDLSNFKAAQVDVNLRAEIKETLILGVNYRMNDSFSPIIGLQRFLPTGKLRVGYGYDYTISSQQNFTSGSHEIVVKYLHFIGKPKEIEGYKNVRFL